MGCCREDIDEAYDDADNHPKVRGCTDVFMLVLFILFWFFLILIAAFAFVFGSPRRLVHGYDSFGNTCGTKNEKMGELELSGLDMTARRFVFFLDTRDIKRSLKICVEQCPSRTLNSMEDIKLFYNETHSDLCRYDFNGTFKRDQLLNSALGPCPALPVYESTVVLHRCVPKIIGEAVVHIVSNFYGVINSWDTVEQVLSDLYIAWPHVLIFSVISFFISLLVISLLHFLASVVAWIFMLLISLISIACTAILWWTYATIKYELDAKPIQTLLIQNVQNEAAFLTFSIIATVLTVILLLLVIAMRKHVSFVSDLFREAAKCLAQVPGLFIQPIITFLILLAFFTFWVSVAICLSTANYAKNDEVKPYSNLDVPTTVPSQPVSETQTGPSHVSPLNFSVDTIKEHKIFTLVKFEQSSFVRYMWWAHIIGLIWTSEFILSCQQMVISGAVASWYFNKAKQSGTEEYPILQAIRRLLYYHMGSVALGSFLITIFKLPRLILMFIQTKLKANKETSDIAKCGLKCCICCFYCLECFIQFMNHNAYTVIAMQGHNFCLSARIAFRTIMNNALKFTTLNSVGDFILFLGKCIVTLITTLSCILYLKHDNRLNFYAVPVLLVAIFSFFIAHAIISLYEIVIDTLFLCLCEDSRMNKEDGKWRESKLVAPSSVTNNTELTPINN